jgi:hypothetical protein
MTPGRAFPVALAALAATALAPAAAGAPPPLAFPGAEGAGRHAAGGRGGAVLHVTTLADSGPGSLRAAVEARGPRTILFAVAGTIRLKADLVIREPRVTIAGQSAPGGGITLADHGLVIRADDVVVRHLRVRRGPAGGEGDAIWVAGGSRIILDHVSASWSTDETLSVSGPREGPPPRDVTVQWSLIAESLRRSVHAKGEHGYGSLVRGSDGAEYSFHHNLWAHHQARMPRPGNYRPVAEDPTGPLMQFRSNLFYNWGGKASGYNADSAARATYNFIDNSYRPGPDSRGRLAFREENSEARAYFAGNLMAGAPPADPWLLVEGADRPGYRLAAPAPTAPVAAEPAAAAEARILAHAGAACWRDPVDTRVVADVAAGTGRLIDDPAEVGGWPALPAGRPAPDQDGDGMPDSWERATGSNPAKADSNAPAPDGLTRLEAWLAHRAAACLAPARG